MNAMNYISGLVLLFFAWSAEIGLFNGMRYDSYSSLFVPVGLILLAVGVLSHLGIAERVFGRMFPQLGSTRDRDEKD